MRSGMSRSWYLIIRRAIKQTVLIIEANHFCQLHITFYKDRAVKVNSKCRQNYWG